MNASVSSKIFSVHLYSLSLGSINQTFLCLIQPLVWQILFHHSMRHIMIIVIIFIVFFFYPITSSTRWLFPQHMGPVYQTVCVFICSCTTLFLAFPYALISPFRACHHHGEPLLPMLGIVKSHSRLYRIIKRLRRKFITYIYNITFNPLCVSSIFIFFMIAA